MTDVLDFAYGFTPGLGLKIVAAGYVGVMRYLSGGGPKDLTKAEIADYQAAGLAIGLIWETTAQRMLDGGTAGTVDGTAARAQANALGVPTSVTIYFTADFDVAASEITTCRAYMASASRQGPSGIYGGVLVVGAMPSAYKRWQTFAWSAGQKAKNLDLYQQPGQVSVGGVTADVDQRLTDAGLWEANMAGEADSYFAELGKRGVGAGDYAGNQNFALGQRFKALGIATTDPLYQAHATNPDFQKGYEIGVPAGGTGSGIPLDTPIVVSKAP